MQTTNQMQVLVKHHNETKLISMALYFNRLATGWSYLLSGDSLIRDEMKKGLEEIFQVLSIFLSDLVLLVQHLSQ